jgi:hypothetical protein
MILWAFIVVVLAILSYLGDAGILPILYELRYPPLAASQYSVSLMSTLLLLCGLGMMARIGYRIGEKEKEKLRERVQELEGKLGKKPPAES